MYNPKQKQHGEFSFSQVFEIVSHIIRFHLWVLKCFTFYNRKNILKNSDFTKLRLCHQLAGNALTASLLPGLLWVLSLLVCPGACSFPALPRATPVGLTHPGAGGGAASPAPFDHSSMTLLQVPAALPAFTLPPALLLILIGLVWQGWVGNGRSRLPSDSAFTIRIRPSQNSPSYFMALVCGPNPPTQHWPNQGLQGK